MTTLWSKLLLGSAFVMVSLTSIPASADPAIVLNSGRDGLICGAEIEGPMVGYFGDATFVTTQDGRVNIGCHADILGAPPPETLITRNLPLEAIPGVFCTVIITKKGILNATCHN